VASACKSARFKKHGKTSAKCKICASWGHLGGFAGGHGGILELLRCAWGHLGGLVASWDVLGATLGRFGVDLGASWAHLGPS
jgi:hypothetical protein